MKRRIIDFTELKAFVDIFNERDHPGFREPLNPFQWWNFKHKGWVSDTVHAYIDSGLVVLLEIDDEDYYLRKRVSNMLVFALCKQPGILKKILDICKDYAIVNYNSEFRDRYRNITAKLDGASWESNGRYFYVAHGGESWEKLYG
jgi:hypothetical protein